jgi:small-conductance mechanosensitive channel
MLKDITTSADNHIQMLEDIAPEIIISIVIIGFTFALTKLSSKIVATSMHRMHLKHALIEFVQTILSFLIWLCGILLVTSLLFPSVTPAKILTTLGFGSIAVGFAFKDIFENFMAGVLILLREPFKIKDFIEVTGIIGSVEKITIRDTYLIDLDGQRVVIPNATLFKNNVTVLTYKNTRRITIVCGIAYSEDVTTAKKLLLKEIKKLKTVSKEDPLEVRADHFGDSSINLKIYWYTQADPKSVRISIDEVVTQVKRTLDDAKIEIPFPYRTLVFKNLPKININP